MKKLLWCIPIILIVLVLNGCKKEEEKPLDVFKAYLSAWQQQNYAGMYDKLTPKAKIEITKEDFVQRYQKIYEGIEAKQLTITDIQQEIQDPDKDVTEMALKYHLRMDTLAGPLEFDHQATLSKNEIDKETKWMVEWEPSLIFPQMEDGDKVRVQTTRGERGEILDRNGNGLAVNRTAPQIGIIPGKIGDAAENWKAQLADMLKISVEVIDKKLSASWVKPDHFVPLTFVSEDALNDYLTIPGVDYQKKKKE